MPYIDLFRRTALEEDPTDMRVAGELNYQLTRVIIDYLESQGLCYRTCNDIVGALENAKHEFQRRIQDPYEDQKISANGDVY